MKYQDWLREWLQNEIEPTAKARTFDRYSEIAICHLVPNLGEYELDELSPIVLQHFVAGLLQTGNLKTGKGLSANSVGGIINVVSKDGKPVAVRSYQRTFELLQRKIKIPHRGFHSLRHTFATRALECGMDVKTLSEILGHKSPTVTLNRYVHSLMEHKQSMMNRLGKLL